MDCIFRTGSKCDAGFKSEQETRVAGVPGCIHMYVAIVNEILMDALICKYYFDVVKSFEV
jgi:hypothetical protein